MKTINIKQIGLGVVASLALFASFSIPMYAQENKNPYGSSATIDNREYTIEEMLKYAIEDEYVAEAEYNLIISKYGNVRPFSNIVRSEGKHIDMLTPLFKAHNVTIPKNTAKDYVALPASLLESYPIGVEAEIKNIAMYDKFLSQDLPDDIRTVFNYLKNASENHLRAFERNVDKGSSATQGSQKGRSGNRKDSRFSCNATDIQSNDNTQGSGRNR